MVSIGTGYRLYQGREVPFAADDGLHGLDYLGQGLSLERIPPGACFQGLAHEEAVAVHREDHDGRHDAAAAQLVGERDAVRVLEAHVEDHQIGLPAARRTKAGARAAP
jgi:hypothetical protein